MTDLVNGLGGPAGFGENGLPRTDDGSSTFIDLSSVLPGGLNFFGSLFTGLWVNNNGSVSFASTMSSFTPTAITGTTANPLITPFWADVDTRGTPVAPSAGGNSAGSNLVWYDLDAGSGAFTVTWDDVGYFNRKTDKSNAFQLQLIAVGSAGDFDMAFRYESMSWTTGDFSGGSGGLGGTVARAGWTSGNGLNYLELPQSGVQDEILALDEASNIGTPGAFLFSIRDGAVTANLSVGDARIVEGDGTTPRYALVPVTLSSPLDTLVTVRYATGNGTARAGQDFVGQSGVVIFGPGQTTQEIRVEILGDAIAEADETFILRIAGGNGATIADAQATITIANDDGLVVDDANATEGTAGTPGSMSFTVRLLSAASGTVTVDFATQDGTATAGTDYTATSGTLTFAAGETSKTVTVQLLGDATGEPTEALSLLLSGAAGSVIADANATGTIQDDDRIRIADVSVTEGTASTPGSVTVTVSLAGPTDRTITVDFATEDGTATAGLDYTATSGTATISSGQSSTTITVPILRDAAVESGEAFGIRLSNPSGATIEDDLAAVTIIDDDGFRISDVWLTEGSGGSTNMTFTVILSSALSASATIDYATSDGTAVAGTDYTATSGTLTFSTGLTSRTFSVPVITDTDTEASETFSVTLSNASAGAILRASATGTILDDDGLTISNVSVTEGDSGTVTATATVTLTSGASPVTVDWVTASGTAAAGEDFVADAGTLSFAPGETSKTISVTVNGDTDWEANEAFRIILSNPSNASIVDGSGTVTINNDDTRAAPEVSVLFARLTEGSGDASGVMRFVVSLSYSIGTAVTVDYATTDHTAIGGVDYTLGTGTLTIAAGATSGFIDVPILADSTVEADETFLLSLSNPTGGATIAKAGAFGRILNDDASVSIAALAADVAEGDSGSAAATFVVTRSGELGVRHGVRWAVGPSGVDGAAANGADFAGGSFASGWLAFAPGEASKTITLNIAGDTSGEVAEGFLVRLLNPSDGLSVGTADAWGSIRNDDIITGTMGADRLVGGGDDDTIHGLDDDDTIWGGSGNDQLIGGDGNDRLIGGPGTNLLDGGEGDDVFVVRSATDTVVDSGGTDMIETHVSFTLPAGVETLAIWAATDIDGTGNADNDRLFGGDGANRLNGLGGDDLLVGGAGADTLIGGSGTDTLTGGSGADVFSYGALTDSTIGAVDQIRDFVSGTDILDLGAIGTEIGGWGTVRFVTGTAFTAPLQVAWDAASGVLRVEGDGNIATVELVVSLRGASLVESDIVFA